EKMKEINEAYDTITKSRAGGSQGGYSGYGGTYQAQSQQYTYQRQQNADSGTVFARVRACINRGDFSGAEQLLRSAPQQTAEWHFLYGYLAYQKGWLDEATQHFRTACSMEPGNMEYRQALAMMQRGGMGYRSPGYGSTECDPCTTYMCISCLTPWGGPCC
ncbi:MAG: tetratricopeptide repeat protein, partial [Oscillospiraceae bacterium]|nr:tetratricopeptide repeat protein [Oscillospiraceae bacterium]